MIIPDSRCETHGIPFNISISKSHPSGERYCLECRREKEGRKHRNNTPYCWRGHPKTMNNWRYREGHGYSYCWRCASDRTNERNARKRRAQLPMSA